MVYRRSWQMFACTMRHCQCLSTTCNAYICSYSSPYTPLLFRYTIEVRLFDARQEIAGTRRADRSFEPVEVLSSCQLFTAPLTCTWTLLVHVSVGQPPEEFEFLCRTLSQLQVLQMHRNVAVYPLRKHFFLLTPSVATEALLMPSLTPCQ